MSRPSTNALSACTGASVSPRPAGIHRRSTVTVPWSSSTWKCLAEHTLRRAACDPPGLERDAECGVSRVGVDSLAVTVAGHLPCHNAAVRFDVVVRGATVVTPGRQEVADLGIAGD